MAEPFVILLVGRGGKGVQSLARELFNLALPQFPGSTLLPRYGPEVRGGLSEATLCLSQIPVLNPAPGECDLLVLLDPAQQADCIRRLRPGAQMLQDADVMQSPESLFSRITALIQHR